MAKLSMLNIQYKIVTVIVIIVIIIVIIMNNKRRSIKQDGD